MYLFLSLKGWQSSILWSVLCRFHSLYHFCHSLSLIAICCHSSSYVVSLVVTLYPSLSLVVTFCHSLYHSLLLIVIRCTTRCYSLSFVVTRCHFLSFVVPLVVSRCTTRCHSLSHECTTRLSFYDWLIFANDRVNFIMWGITSSKLHKTKYSINKLSMETQKL